MSKQMEKIFGVILPIPSIFLERFNKKRKVFVRVGRLIQLSTGMKLIFYASGKIKALAASARVEEIDFGSADYIFAEFGPTLFLNEKEFWQYARGTAWNSSSQPRKTKILTAIRLSNFFKFPTPFKPMRPVTVSGRYLRYPEKEFIESKLKR